MSHTSSRSIDSSNQRHFRHSEISHLISTQLWLVLWSTHLPSPRTVVGRLARQHPNVCMHSQHGNVLWQTLQCIGCEQRPASRTADRQPSEPRTVELGAYKSVEKYGDKILDEDLTICAPQIVRGQMRLAREARAVLRPTPGDDLGAGKEK